MIERQPLRSRHRAAGGVRTPLAEVWDGDILPILMSAAAVRAIMVLDVIMGSQPEISVVVRRTLERGMRGWRALAFRNPGQRH